MGEGYEAVEESGFHVGSQLQQEKYHKSTEFVHGENGGIPNPLLHPSRLARD